MDWRKRFAEDRKAFNDDVWDRVLHISKVESKSKSFSFHHEIMTDGVSASLLYSRPIPTKSLEKSRRPESAVSLGNALHPPSRSVGLDPGKKNVFTMTEADGNTLRYTARQRAN